MKAETLTTETLNPAHTPGPWTFDQHSHEIESGFGLVATLANEGKSIPQDSEGEANARLIASAPELLEALEYISDTQLSLRQILEAARAAIAKAEGDARP